MTSQPTYPTAPTTPREPPARMKPLNWILLVLGVLITIVGLGLTIGGAVLAGAGAAQSDGQYPVVYEEIFQSTGHAILAPPLVLDASDTGSSDLASTGEIASARVQVSSMVADQDIFIGIADSADVGDYLNGVPHTVLGDLSWQSGQPSSAPPEWFPSSDTGVRQQEIDGTRTPELPTDQDFWAVSASGAGTQEITFDLQPGAWTLVVMNSDASRSVWADLRVGVRTELLDSGTPAVWIAGLLALLLGIPLLLVGAAGLGRDISRDISRGGNPGLDPTYPQPDDSFRVHPLTFTGHLDGKLSRGLWLIKWLLVIPHYLILGLLWFAQLITTIAAGVAILFTGRYPRSWFAFSVGVLRWQWRVGFYAYAALGTDRYPPFTLAHADYPATLDVAYPEQLSRGLVLVKWWLLALPHLFIVALLTGNSGSLLGLLILIIAVALLFTGRYLPGLFNLVMGMERWTYRVVTYTLLLRDEYPPFRLDQGPTDPAPTGMEATG